MHKPLIMAHCGRMSEKFRENSLEGVLDTLKKGKAEIIELDIRKRREGRLICYHGYPWWRFILARFFPVWGEVNALEEIVRVIPGNRIVFLDIKDRRVKSEEILQACSSFRGEIWVASVSLRYLWSVRNKRFKLVYNFGFVWLSRGVRLAKEIGVSIIKVFPWQEGRDPGIRFACFGKGKEGEWRVG